MQVGWEKLHPGQGELDLGLDPTVLGGAVVQSQSSRLLVEVIRTAWNALGFDVIADEGFFQLVLARLVEPTSMVDSRRVLEELGVTPVHYSTFKRARSDKVSSSLLPPCSSRYLISHLRKVSAPTP